MFRFILPTTLIAIGLGLILGIASPAWSDVSVLRSQVDSLDQALDNSKNLERERDMLVNKQNSMSSLDILKLERMLPDSVENIRLIIEIENIAFAYGMVLDEVKYDAYLDEETEETQGVEVLPGGVSKASDRNYGEWDLEFSTYGSYTNFLSFLADIEKNLRIVDVTSVKFSSESPNTVRTTQGVSTATSSYLDIPSGPDVYKYTFNVKTYWMKNQ
jgi:Tfp pilus assembly protein PilO